MPSLLVVSHPPCWAKVTFRGGGGTGGNWDLSQRTIQFSNFFLFQRKDLFFVIYEVRTCNKGCRNFSSLGWYRQKLVFSRMAPSECGVLKFQMTTIVEPFRTGDGRMPAAALFVRPLSPLTSDPHAPSPIRPHPTRQWGDLCYLSHRMNQMLIVASLLYQVSTIFI